MKNKFKLILSVIKILFKECKRCMFSIVFFIFLCGFVNCYLLNITSVEDVSYVFMRWDSFILLTLYNIYCFVRLKNLVLNIKRLVERSIHCIEMEEKLKKVYGVK